MSFEHSSELLRQLLEPGQLLGEDDGPDLSSLDLSSFDPSSFDPEAFVREIHPSVHMASPAEVREEALARSRNIFDSFHMLSNILLRHEATIQKRWAKKTRQQRQKILLSAWPNMAPTHRPDFDAFRRGSKPGKLSVGEDKFKDHYMWPHINQGKHTQGTPGALFGPSISGLLHPLLLFGPSPIAAVLICSG
jgi:hypothetical protein